MSTATRRNNLKSSRSLAVPSTTLHRGSSATHTGKPVSSLILLSRFLRSAPPPARTMPRSLISAESSGGVRSRGRTDCAHNCGHAFIQRFADLAIVHGNRLGNALYETSALDLHCHRFLESGCRPNLDFDLFRHAFTDQQVIFPFHIVHDGLVHVITGCTQ